MFRVMRNNVKSGTVLRDARVLIQSRLPEDWLASPGGSSLQPTLALRGPNGSQVTLAVEVRASLEPRDVAAIMVRPMPPQMVMAPYLGPRTRDLLEQSGVGFVDLTGNLRLVVSEPCIFLSAAGAARDPVPTPRALQSLRGAAAGRVVRALVELALPVGVRGLAIAAETPLATVSRVVSFLETEAIVMRDAEKRVVEVDWQALLVRWSTDYAITRSNELQTYLEPRGLASLYPKLSRLSRYAATGSLAGPGIAPPRIAMLYVDEPNEAAETLGLVPAEAGANVWLLRPYDDVVFVRTQQRLIGGGVAGVTIVTVSDAQAVVDLASCPGRGPQESEALVERMKERRDVAGV